MKKIFIIVCILILLVGCGIESKSYNSNNIRKCSEFCLKNNMTLDDYTGVDNDNIKCVCFKWFDKLDK